MFVQQPDLTCLKQGDVLRDVVFPIARVDSTRILGRAKYPAPGQFEVEAILDGTAQRPHHIFQVQGTTVPCAVLSQCCDVVKNQEPPPHSFVLCKLISVPKSIRKHQPSYDVLRANVDPYGDRKAFLSNFWFGPLPLLGGEYMAEFAQVMTASWTDYEALLRHKVGELDDLNRAMFRVKIGAHFGRVAPEDKDAGYEDPYERADAPLAPPIQLGERLKLAWELLKQAGYTIANK